MKKQIKYLVLALVLILMTGCTRYIKGDDGKTVISETTGQSLTENILCRPTDEEIIMLYEVNGYDINKLPSCVCRTDNEKENVDGSETLDTIKEDSCQEFTITSGEYDGLWTTIFVKPLAWVILLFGKLTGKFGLGLIITSLLIRLILFPLTKKSTEQAEKMKEIQPELEKLEKKYAGKDQNDREVAMAKSQEMMMIYKKHNISPLSGCLPALLQLPLLMAFLDAINRVPAIFEENFLGFHLGTTPKIGISGGNWLYVILTVLVALTTYFSFAKTQNNNSSNPDMANQTKMMTNVFTVMIIVMSFFMNSALNIYWIVSNIFTLLQNYLVKRSMK